ncbi:hypothetical protein BJY00DRAFT_271099 [Aspergillus carlsbadensis]|nr:hypothetical protein BJY00DRAFT_271099 [Aspergillus carlsbadensis]
MKGAGSMHVVVVVVACPACPTPPLPGRRRPKSPRGSRSCPGVRMSIPYLGLPVHVPG